MEAFDRVALLRSSFPPLTADQAARLEQNCAVRRYAHGSFICEEGKLDTTIYLLVDGSADILLTIDDNDFIAVDTLKPGNYFGEIGPLGKTSRAASVRAVGDARVLYFDSDTFLVIVYENQALLRYLIERISVYMRDSDRAVIQELRTKNLELREAQNQREEQERLRSRFITTLSHELRTPLTAAQGYLHLIQAGMLAGDDLQNGLQTVTKNVQRMVHIINHLMILYETDVSPPQYEYIRVSRLLKNALSDTFLTGGHTDKSQVVIEVDADTPDLYADEATLTLALRILIENGLRFSPDGDQVRVSCRQIDDKHIQIDVIDQGIGIPAMYHERIFEPFFRVEDENQLWNFPGIGVGLPIARFIIERHGGTVLLRSAPEEGSTFSLLLPLIAEGATAPSA